MKVASVLAAPSLSAATAVAPALPAGPAAAGPAGRAAGEADPFDDLMNDAGRKAEKDVMGNC